MGLKERNYTASTSYLTVVSLGPQSVVKKGQC